MKEREKLIERYKMICSDSLATGKGYINHINFIKEINKDEHYDPIMMAQIEESRICALMKLKN